MFSSYQNYVFCFSAMEIKSEVLPVQYTLSDNPHYSEAHHRKPSCEHYKITCFQEITY